MSVFFSIVRTASPLLAVLAVGSLGCDSGNTKQAPAADAQSAADAAPECFRCSDVMARPDTFDPDLLCEQSVPVFEALFACACGRPDDPSLAACGAECADTTCAEAGGQPSNECANCIAQQCGPETGACLNDGV